MIELVILGALFGVGYGCYCIGYNRGMADGR